LSVIFLLPHFFLSVKQFGSPFYNENWKNLAFKLYSAQDWSYFERVPFDGYISVIVSSPLRLLYSTLKEIVRFFDSVLYFAGGKGLAGGMFAAGTVGGLYRMVFVLDRKKILLLIYLMACVFLTAFLFISGVRFVLPILPILYLLCGDFILHETFNGSLRLGRMTMKRTTPIVILFFAFLLLATVRHMGFYINAHPLGELEAARFLQRNYGSEIAVCGTFPFMDRYVTYDYNELEDALPSEVDDETLYYKRLESLLLDKSIDFIIIGRLTLERRPPGLLSMKHLPTFLKTEFHNDEAVVYKVVP
jgi:hypothetical protein